MALRTRNGGSQTPDYWLKLARNTQPRCPDSGNRKSVFKETVIPVVETFIINPLECNHAPRGVNTFKGGHDYDQVSRDCQA